MSNIIKCLAQYNKFWVALLGACAQAALEVYGTDQRVQFIAALLTALGVLQVRNR